VSTTDSARRNRAYRPLLCVLAGFFAYTQDSKIRVRRYGGQEVASKAGEGPAIQVLE
jgi:hypothetical protein